MKKTNNIKKIIAIALFSVFTAGFAPAVKASDSTNYASPVELKFLGNFQDLPVFQLDLNNAEEEEFVITIRNESGNLLYSDKVKGAKISRKFKFDTDELEDGLLLVEVKPSKNKAEIFKVSTKVRFVQETSVSKLK